VHQLIEDHQLAQKLAIGLVERFPGAIDPGRVDTNLVLVDFAAMGSDWHDVAERLASANIKVNAPVRGGWRIVTHRDVDESDVERLLAVLG
jgi:threonine aldolase